PLLDREDRAIERRATALLRELFHERARAAGVGLELQGRRFAVPERNRRSLRLLPAATAGSARRTGGGGPAARARPGPPAASPRRTGGRALRASAIGAERRRGGGDEGEEHEVAAIHARQ